MQRTLLMGVLCEFYILYNRYKYENHVAMYMYVISTESPGRDPSDFFNDTICRV